MTSLRGPDRHAGRAGLRGSRRRRTRRRRRPRGWNRIVVRREQDGPRAARAGDARQTFSTPPCAASAHRAGRRLTAVPPSAQAFERPSGSRARARGRPTRPGAGAVRSPDVRHRPLRGERSRRSIRGLGAGGPTRARRRARADDERRRQEGDGPGNVMGSSRLKPRLHLVHLSPGAVHDPSPTSCSLAQVGNPVLPDPQLRCLRLNAASSFIRSSNGRRHRGRPSESAWPIMRAMFDS